jgi:hypothetical protein
MRAIGDRSALFVATQCESERDGPRALTFHGRISRLLRRIAPTLLRFQPKSFKQWMTGSGDVSWAPAQRSAREGLASELGDACGEPRLVIDGGWSASRESRRSA